MKGQITRLGKETAWFCAMNLLIKRKRHTPVDRFHSFVVGDVDDTHVHTVEVGILLAESSG